MTKVVFFRRGDVLLSFTSEGHAGDMPEGENIICAAVSALTQTCYLGIKEVLKENVDLAIDEDIPYLCVKPERPENERIQVLLKTLLEGLRCIQNQYPGAVRIICKERR